MMRRVFLFVALFSVAFGGEDVELGVRSTNFLTNGAVNFDGLDPEARIDFINEWVDVVLSEARKVMSEVGLDPMELPEIHKRISIKPIIITYWGEMNLTRGWLQDASTLKRNGNVKLDYEKRILTAVVPMSFDDFIFDYEYAIRIMGLGPTGGIDGKTDDVRFYVTLEIDFPNMHVTLKKFQITKINKIRIKFTGHILVDWLLNLTTGVVTTVFKGLIKWVIEIVIKGQLVSVVDAINDVLANLPPVTTTTLASTVL